ncbi:MAG: OmpA family protein [Betaproteobacteria bacterium]
MINPNAKFAGNQISAGARSLRPGMLRLLPLFIALSLAGCATKALHPSAGMQADAATDGRNGGAGSNDPASGPSAKPGKGSSAGGANKPGGKAANSAGTNSGGKKADGTSSGSTGGADGGANSVASRREDGNASSFDQATDGSSSAAGGAGTRGARGDGTTSGANGKPGTGAGGAASGNNSAGANSGAGGAKRGAGAAGNEAGGANGNNAASNGAGGPNGAGANGAGANGAGANGAGANGAAANGAGGPNGTGANGAGANAAGTNGTNGNAAGGSQANGGRNGAAGNGDMTGDSSAGANANGVGGEQRADGGRDGVGLGVGEAGVEDDEDRRIAAIDVPNSNVRVDEEFKPQTLGGMLPLVLGVNEEGKFDFDQYALRDEVKGILDDLAGKLTTAEFDRLDIIGYTDRIGSSQYNQRLSELRAWAVAQYLIHKGIPDNKVFYEGRGNKAPLTQPGECSGLGREELITCLQKDRRVEVEASIRRKHATVTQ